MQRSYLLHTCSLPFSSPGIAWAGEGVAVGEALLEAYKGGGEETKQPKKKKKAREGSCGGGGCGGSGGCGKTET